MLAGPASKFKQVNYEIEIDLQLDNFSRSQIQLTISSNKTRKLVRKPTSCEN